MKLFKKIYKKYCDFIRFFRFKKNIKTISNISFSIFSSDCIAGIIYHDLRKEFTSPTINLYFSEHNYSFLNFCLDPDYYLNNPLTFLKNGNLPRAIIKGDKNHEDIQVNFAHYIDENDAKNSWQRRCKRVSKNHIFIYLKYKLDENDIKLISKIDKILVITSDKTDSNYLNNRNIRISKYLSKLDKNNGKIMSYKGIFGSRNFDDLKILDYIKENIK